MTITTLFGDAITLESEYRSDARIVLYLGDTLDLLATIPDETIKLVVTSPPYNVGKEYETRVGIEQYLKKQEEVIAELYRTLRSDGSICWQVGNYVHDSEIFPLDMFYYPIFKSLGMKLRNRIVWHFGHGLHARKRFSGRYETLLWFTKGDTYTFNLDDVRVPSKYPGKRHYKGAKKGQLSGNPKGKNPSDIWLHMANEWETGLWDIPNVKSNHPEKTKHPAQFPIELAERCVLAMSNPDDWVFDPYAGVASTLVAALKRGRRAMGSDKESGYIDIARQRISDYFAGTLKMRPLGKPVYQPTGKEKIAQYPEQWQAKRLLEKGVDWNLSNQQSEAK